MRVVRRRRIIETDPGRWCFVFSPLRGIRGVEASTRPVASSWQTFGRVVVTLVVGAVALVANAAAGPTRSSELVYASFSVGPVTTPTVAGVADLFIAPPTHRWVQRLTRSVDWEGQPAWSPDGRQIAYSSGEALCHNGSCHGQLEASIWVADAFGGRPPRQLYAPRELTNDQTPTWSPDGRRIAFSRFGWGDGVFGLYVVSSDGGRPRRLVAGYALSPDWSPDGVHLAYLRPDDVDGEVALRVVDLHTGRGRTLATSGIAGVLLHAAWSPDGHRLALATSKGVFIVPARGGRARRVVGDARPYRDVAWSPDGSRLALGESDPYWWESGGHKARIAIVKIDGSGLRRLALGPGSQIDPDWR
jgi:Tol biopolymer transport system component